jgi:hypothetical protein
LLRLASAATGNWVIGAWIAGNSSNIALQRAIGFRLNILLERIEFLFGNVALAVVGQE